MNPKVDDFISKATAWQEELEQLREIALDCMLTEELKWGAPCYTYNGNNIIIIQGFKSYCALMFFKGALLHDAEGLLIKPGENTQAGRQIRITDIRDIVAKKSVLKAYIFEAIEVEKAGLDVEFKETKAYIIPEELQQKLDQEPHFKIAFETLTPGRQRAYILHFSEPKQSQTRTARIEKQTQRILNGKGLTDCICGLTKRRPSCDGSHKYI
ncbi:MAG: DUF1801 domain-containing protein [Bacteroidales bacterium]|nr:DUF1801 domain-containing protein [Bacteroidales bacterium]